MIDDKNATNSPRQTSSGTHAAADTIGISPNDLLYARVDLAETGADEYVLLELELVEPSLFLLHAPDAAEQYADELMALLE